VTLSGDAPIGAEDVEEKFWIVMLNMFVILDLLASKTHPDFDSVYTASPNRGMFGTLLIPY
jgi:hypothetical protein